MKEALPRVNYEFDADNSKLRNVLGIQPIPVPQSVKDMAHAIIKFGFVPNKAA